MLQGIKQAVTNVIQAGAAPTVDGIDVSKWQGIMDWVKAKSAGAQYAFIRAGAVSTVGIKYQDYQFTRNSEIAPDLMPVGYYWYFRPQFDPVGQADYFCDLIEDKRWELPPVLDWEFIPPSMSPAANTKAAGDFALHVNERLGVLPIVYSRGAWLNANTVTDPFLSMLDLWVARYTVRGKPWGNVFDYKSVTPRDYDTWRFWQWSAGGNGRGAEFGAQSKSIDLDRFNGDQTAFDRYVGVVPEPEPKVPDDIGVKVDVEGVKYRGRIARV